MTVNITNTKFKSCLRVKTFYYLLYCFFSVIRKTDEKIKIAIQKYQNSLSENV